jgi:hypothetical protein
MMPSTLIGIYLWVGGLRESAVDALALPWRRRLVDRSPGLRTTKAHLPVGLADREDYRDRRRRQMTGHECQGLCRGPIQPVHIVHQADQRPRLGRFRQQAQGGQADREAARYVPVLHVERGPQGVTLRTGKSPEPVQERRA